jgi:hypothetical protein
MACILEIRKTIQKSIDEKLLLSKNVGIVKRGAEKIRDYLNDLWDSPIAVVKRNKFNGNVYVVEIKSLDAAVNKEFKKQLAAERSFKRDLAFFNNDSRLFIQEDKEEVGPFNYTSNEEITNAIKKQLPVEISNTVTVIQDVPLDILGRDDLFLSLKEILNDNNVKDEILINWAGVNKDAINIKSIKSEQQLERIINSVYDKKKDVNNHPELKINKLALESFNKWVNALEKFPIAFKEIMLSHAIKQLNPKRRSKYVLQLSDVALTQAYGIVVNKPHELNRIGKLYDQEVLKTVSDAIGHEPSASGNGYWVHIPRTSSEELSNPYSGEQVEDSFINPYLTIKYQNAVIINDIQYIKSPTTSKWSKINNKDQFKINVELLRKLSPSTWCTADGMAAYYVENHDNYILIVNGITVAGIEAYPSKYTNEDLELAIKKVKKEELKYEEADEKGKLYNDSDIEYYEKNIADAVKRVEEIRNEKTKVKDVTLRGKNQNNLSALSDYDDILAFFEKHNLDTNNRSLQNAKNAKDAGKVDAQVFKDIDDQRQEEFEDDPIYEYDEYDQDDYYEAMGRQHDAERDRVSLFNSIDEVKANIDLAVKHFYELREEFRNNKEIATFAVESDSHNISQINSALPFYNELAKKAIQTKPYVYTYLSLEAQQIPEIKKIYEESLELNADLGDDLPFSKTNTNQIQGYYDAKNDKVVVVASNTPVNEAAKVAIHEVAHRGMVRMAKDLGGTKELNKILLNSENELMKKLPELLKRTGHDSLKSLMLDYGFTTESEEGKVKLLSELAARWAETLVNKPKPSWWKDFLTSIQEWITKFTGKILNEKQVNELVGGFVKYGTKVNQTNSESSPQTQQEPEVKPGVEELFDSNPELAKLGTVQQYSQYLNSIFPDSKVKDIVYHGSGYTFDTFKEGRNSFIFFTKSKDYASVYAQIGIESLGEVKPILKETIDRYNFLSRAIYDSRSYEANQFQDLLDNLIDNEYDAKTILNKIKNTFSVKEINKLYIEPDYERGMIHDSGDEDIDGAEQAFYRDDVEYWQTQKINSENEESNRLFHYERTFADVLYQLKKYLRSETKRLTKDNYFKLKKDLEKVTPSENVYKAILDIKNPQNVSFEIAHDTIEENLSKIDKSKDSIIGKEATLKAKLSTGTKRYQNEDSVAVKSSKQIHILGSKQDIEGFKNFVGKKEVKPIEPTPKVYKSNQTELFQIEKQESRLKEKYLVDRVNVLLGDYIKANNIKVEFLDKITSKDGQEVIAKYDSVKRIIQINSNEASALTLPEELAHDLTLALGIDHVLVKRALNLIGRLDYKGILGQQYVDAYKGDVNLLKMELLGKLISRQIADPKLPDELKSEDGVKIWETIKNAIKAFISLFKPNSNITSELDNIVSELSDMIISGKEVGDPTMSVEMFDINSTIHDVKKGFPMTNSNNQKLLSREKTFTLRTKNHPSGLYKFGKNYYNVLNMYGKAVKADEIKNPDYLKKKFVGDEDIRFNHVKAFFDGTEPLYVYQITKVDDSIQAMLEEQAKSGGIPQDVEKYYVFYTRLISKLKKDVKKINNSLSDESKRIEAKIQEIEATLQNLIYNNNKQNLIDLAHKTIDDVDTYLKKLYALEQSGQNFNVKNIEKSIKVLHTFENLEEVGERARLLISSLKRFGIKLLDEEHLRLTGREITDKEKNEIQQDINYGELQFGTLSDVRNYLGKTIGLSIKEKQSIIEKNNKESKKILDIEIKKLEEFQKTQGITGKDIYKIFIQEHRGSTVLTKPYTSDYYKLIADSFEKENGSEIRKKLSVYNSKSNNWEPKDSSYYSDNYKEIHKKGNEPLLEFYNFFKKTIADITDKLPVDELDENFIPNIVEATLLSVLKSDKDSVGKLKDGINHIMSANFWSTRENEFFINRELEKNEVPLKYIGNIPSDKKSNDLGYVLLNFMHFGNSYEQMSDLLPKVELFQELMQEKQFIVSKKRNAGSSTNLNSLIDGFIKMQVKGEMKSDNDYFGDNAPIIDFALTYTSLLRIGFSPFAAAANFAVGGTGNMIEAMGGRYFNLANLTEANSIFLAQSFNENSKLSNIISKVNPLMEIDDFLSLEDIQKGSNSYTQKLKSGAYFLQRIGEKKLQVSVMIAIMLNNKVTTKNGDKISMWEAFDENGVWDEKLMGYEFLEIDLNKLTNKVQAVNQGIHGRYSSKDAAIFAQQSLFRAVYQFKKWIPAAIESRFGGKKINERLGLETEGRYNSYLKGFKYLWANVKGDIKSIEENKFTELDIYSMRKNLTELLIVTVLLLARAGFEDDKLRKKPEYKFTMNLLNQVSGDLLFFYDPVAMEQSFVRIPIQRTLKDFANIFINIPAIFDDGSKSDKKKYHYRSGPNKGENKFSSSIINVTPGVKQAFDIYRLGNQSPAKK